jgi:teichuronic acid biosynthesis glycosyltransferase TuaH
VTQVDVCLVPFRLNAVTQDVNPIKLYESFSLGKPVVTTALPEVEAYREVAYVAQSKSDFLTGVDRALGEDDDGLRRRRRQIAAENTWALRAQQILGILSSHLHEK